MLDSSISSSKETISVQFRRLSNTEYLNKPSLVGIALLYEAVSNGKICMVKFLLEYGTNVNTVVHKPTHPDTTLGKAVYLEDVDITVLLLEHDANSTCRLFGKKLLDWPSWNCWNTYSLLREETGSSAIGDALRDLVNTANKGAHSLRAYIHKY